MEPEALVGLLGGVRALAEVATYYKPSQWRGKRLIFQSIDPDEPKRERIKIITGVVTIVVALAIVLAVAWFLGRF